MNEEWETIAVGPASNDEWETIAVGAAPEPSFGTKAVDALARGGSNYFSLVGMLGDLLSGKALGRQVSDAITGEQTELPGETLARLAQERIAKPTSDSALERYALGGIEAAPFALMGPVSLAGALGAVGSGVGGEVATDLGMPKWSGEIIGGVAPQSAISLTKSLARPFLSSGQRAIAGQSLLANAGSDGAERLLANADDVASYAEIANTPSAAAYQTAMSKIPGEGGDAMYAALKAQPKEQAFTTLKKLAPDALEGVSQVSRGQALQQEILSAADNAWSAAGNAFDVLNLPEKTKVPVSLAAKEVTKTFDNILGGGALSADSDVLKIVGKLQSEKQLPFKTIKALQSETGATIGRIARSNPKAIELPVLYKVKEQLTKAIDDAVEKGSAFGLSKEKIAAYKAAKLAYAKTGAKFGTPLIKSVTKRGPFGSLEAGAPASTIIPKIIAKPESAKQFMRAMGDNVEQVQQARAGLLDSLPKEFEGWAGYFSKKKEVFKELFGKDFPEVEKIIKGIERRNSVGSLAASASRGQSATAQFGTAMQKLVTNGPRALMRAFGSGTGQGAAGITGYAIGNIPGAIAGAAVSRVVKWAEDNIEQLIQRGMVDPELRKALLAEGTRANQRNLIQKLLPVAANIMSQDPDIKMPESTKKAIAELAAQSAITPQPAATPAATPTAPALSEKLVRAMIRQESSNNPKAVSPKGARGLMQLMPDTAKEVAAELGIKNPDLEDPETNVRLGSHYMQKQLDRFGDVKLALAAYNAGPARVAKWIELYGNDWDQIASAIERVRPDHETLGYVKNILRYYEA